MNRSFRLPRLWSNSVLAEIGPKFTGAVINVSGWDDRDKAGGRYLDYFPKATSYSISNHAGERGLADAGHMSDLEIDLEEPLASQLEGRFDVVFSHTVLEHIGDVGTALGNLCRLSTDIVIVVVPFAQQLHYSPSWGDFWRFTPMGLRRLFANNDLQVIFEAANHHRNAGIYLLVVASRHPEKWEGEMPEWRPVDALGEWIGATIKRRLGNTLQRLKKTTGFGR